MKKRILITVIITCIFISAFAVLNYSSRVNYFIFSSVLNPYDPLEVKSPQPFNEDSLSHDYWEDPRGFFPIMAYNFPEKARDFTSALKVIEKGGINIVVNFNLGWLEDANEVKQAFEELESSNLRWLALIENECKDDYIFGNANNKTNANIKDHLKEFNKDYVYGWYLWDEPGTNRKPCNTFNLIPNNDNADINRMSEQIRLDSSFRGKLDFVNLFPIYWDGTPSSEAYENYIDTFIKSQKFKPKVICFDHYPLLKHEKGGFRQDFFLNLEIIRKKSIEHNIPFWMIVLSSAHDNYRRPTIEEISFQVYSALAYGAEGIGYYLYSKSWEKFGYSSWILEDFVDQPEVADSLHGPLFVPIKKLNSDLQKLYKLLKRHRVIQIFHTSNYPNNQIEIDHLLLKGNVNNKLIEQIFNHTNPNDASKLLISIFEEKSVSNMDRKYLLIINKDFKNDIDISIALNDSFQIYEIDKEKESNNFITKSNRFELSISAGSANLVYIEK